MQISLFLQRLPGRGGLLTVAVMADLMARIRDLAADLRKRVDDLARYEPGAGNVLLRQEAQHALRAHVRADLPPGYQIGDRLPPPGTAINGTSLSLVFTSEVKRFPAVLCCISNVISQIFNID